MNFDAFNNAPWFSTDFRAIIGGVGNIGSWTSLLLARMGYTLFLYDADTVESRNVGSQFYGPGDVGTSKATAMVNHIATLSGNYNVNAMGKYDESSLTDNIVISCFDNMVARKVMFKKWLQFQTSKTVRDPKEVNIFIDGRSLAETGSVFAVKGMKDAERYEKDFLFDDEEADQGLCSYKSTSHNGAIIAGMITTVLVNHIANKLQGEKMRDVPFRIDYQLPIANFMIQ